MRMGEIVKDFFAKVVAPVLLAWLLYLIFSSLFIQDGVVNYFLAWILCGLPFGVWRMRLWLIPSASSSLQYTIGMWALNFIVGGLIGGFVLAWKLLCAAWYLPLTVYRLIVCAGSGNNGAVEISNES